MPRRPGKSRLAAELAAGASHGCAAVLASAAPVPQLSVQRPAMKRREESYCASTRVERAAVPLLWPEHRPRWHAERRGRGSARARIALAANKPAANRGGESRHCGYRGTDDWHRDRDDENRPYADAPEQRPAGVRCAAAVAAVFPQPGWPAAPCPALRAPAEKRGPDHPRPPPTIPGRADPHAPRLAASEPHATSATTNRSRPRRCLYESAR